ncbi:hypothetical protein LHYA1_G009111, partial [Lachnellula hyalina]
HKIIAYRIPTSIFNYLEGIELITLAKNRLKQIARSVAIAFATPKEASAALQNKITSTLLLDVKGAYNHVSKNRLLTILKNLAFPDSVIKWVLSFISGRSLKLLFNG